MFYNLRRAGRRAAQARRDRLRDDDRARHARRAAHRQGAWRRSPASTGAAGGVYDAVVLDAPPTGRIARFLNVNAEVAGLAKVGPIRAQADSVMAVLRSPQHRGAPGHPAGGDAGAGDRRRRRRAARRRPAGRRRRRQHDPAAAAARRRAAKPRPAKRLDRAELAPRLAAAGVDHRRRAASTRCGARPPSTPTRVALESRERAALGSLDRPSYELPLLADAVDLGGLYELAELLAPASG